VDQPAGRIRLADVADLVVVWAIITGLLRIVRDTRTFQMLRGLGLLLLAPRSPGICRCRR